ncbi:MAG: hypothetical protein ACO27E_10475 [Burkholderiaceae bacterium]
MLLAALAACAPTRPPLVPPTPPATTPTPVAPAQPPAQPLARNWQEYHRMAAQRLVKANPDRSYTGAVPEPLKGIPILEVELNGDGSVRQIKVQRRPRPADAQHTVQLAIDAVRRAAPFPPVSHLPRPWAYTEVFLFNDDDRFKPRTLDE